MAWGRGPSTGISDLVDRLAQGDESLRSLTILRFRRLNESDVEALAKALHGNTALQELICSSHSISTEGAAALGAMLRHNQGLKRICIGNSSWGDQALGQLAEGLKHNKAVEAWDLEQKGLTPAAADSISAVLQEHPALQQLLLSRNALQDVGLTRLCGADWRALTHLELSGCAITAEGLKSLAAAASLEQLRHLDLSHNALGPTAAEGLGQLIAAAGQLQCLKLHDTGVGDAGVAGLAEGLMGHSALQHLDLSRTQLDTAGLTALAAALKGSKQQLQAAAAEAAGSGSHLPLQQLVLSGNTGLSDAALQALIAALPAALSAPTSAAAAAAAGADAADATAIANALAAASLADTDTTAAAAQGQGPQQQQQQQQRWVLDLSQTDVGPGSIEALAGLSGLQQLSLFGCKLGSSAVGSAVTPISILQASLASSGFADLQSLNLSGTHLSYDQLKNLLQLLAAAGGSNGGSNGGGSGGSGSSGGGSGSNGVAAALRTLEVGANPGVQHDGFEGLVRQLRQARPELDLHWRVADSDPPPGSQQ